MTLTFELSIDIRTFELALELLAEESEPFFTPSFINSFDDCLAPYFNNSNLSVNEV